MDLPIAEQWVNNLFCCYSQATMWLSDTSRLSRMHEDSDLESSCSSGEEIPIWVRGEQRWVSGINDETTCIDVIQVLCKDEEKRVS